MVCKNWGKPPLVRTADLYFNEAYSIYTAVQNLDRYADEFRIDETDFTRLADEWERDTINISSPSAKQERQAYLELVGMGVAIVPFIIRRMRDNPGDWFDLLASLTGEDPVLHKDWGNMKAMTRAWINWGKRNGYT